MFRRRPVRRALRVARPGPKVRLNQAHALFNQEKYVRSAEIFEDLAEGALRHGIPRAPHLFVQAGRARFYAGQAVVGLAQVKRGLKLFADKQRWGELYRTGKRVVSELEEQGFKEQGEAISEWLVKTLPPKFEEEIKAKATVESKRPALPLKCPSCGGSVDPGEVRWLDTVTAECVFCGSSLRA